MSDYINLGSWLGQSGGIVQMQIPLRAQIQWARIQDKPTDVQFFRQNGITLDPQTVRIEYDDTVSELNSGDMGMGTQRKGIVFGIQGHPDLDDTDIRETDVFEMDGKEFTITFVNRQLHGQIQASFEAVV